MSQFARAAALLIGLCVALSSCGYQGSIRYECQEFQNWKKPECTPPECKVAGVCSKDLVGEKIYESQP